MAASPAAQPAPLAGVGTAKRQRDNGRSSDGLRLRPRDAGRLGRSRPRYHRQVGGCGVVRKEPPQDRAASCHASFCGRGAHGGAMSCCTGEWVNWHPHCATEQRSRYHGCTMIVVRVGERYRWRAETPAGAFEGEADPGPNEELIARNMATWAVRSALTLDR